MAQLNQAGYTTNPLTTERNPDSMQNRLQQIDEVLANSERHMAQINDKLHGPTPAVDNTKAEIPQGISGFIMQINARSQRLLAMLEELSSKLG